MPSAAWVINHLGVRVPELSYSLSTIQYLSLHYMVVSLPAESTSIKLLKEKKLP